METLFDIRPESMEDHEAIQRVELAAFSTPNESRLVNLARERGKTTLSLVAVQAGNVIGHILFTPLGVGSGHGIRGVGLGPIAVSPEFQHTGIGSRLMRAGVEHIFHKGYDFIALLGSPLYYSRFGFKPARSYGLTSDYGDGDEFQAKELRPGALTGKTEKVKYIPEFEETSC